MKLTRASIYALHAVAYMASQKTDKAIASHLIAKERKIKDRFLLKVLKPLVSERVLISIKGPNGGYRLAKPANQITMLEIVEAVEGKIRGNAPQVEGQLDGAALQGKLDNVCQQAADQVRRSLEKVKVSDLVKA